MVGRAIPQEKKIQAASEIKEKWVKEAAKRYKAEQALHQTNPHHQPKSANVCISEVTQECWDEDGLAIQLHRGTIISRANGLQSKRDANAAKGWLDEHESKRVIDYAIEMAERGFPMTLRTLEEIAENIAKARHGDLFPAGGLGHNWADRFVLKHSARLSTYWTHGLDHSRARAVNPITREAYFGLLRTSLEGDGTPEDRLVPELIYGADESGIQPGVGGTQRVIGPKGKSVQHQQQSGDRENITVLLAICADGTVTNPMTIFKGKCYQAAWDQENPLNSSIGRSEKGYIDGEISAIWIQHFDDQTREKARGRRRLLLVDGHSSHYTIDFLEYAHAHRIEILCYPSHSTHVYQGLDVVIFAVLKQRFAEARNTYERRTGKAVNKNTFLAVYAEAHIKALTKENIVASFRKTGVVPFDPHVITDSQTAPSRVTSSKSALPIHLPSPVRIVSHMIMDLQAEQRQRAQLPLGDILNLPVSPPQTPVTSSSVGEAFRFLTTPKITSEMTPPTYAVMAVSPVKMKRRFTELLDDPAPFTTNREAYLAEVLQDSQDNERALKVRVVDLQANTVIQNLYVGNVQSQLQEDEVRKKKKKDGTGGRLNDDGNPKLFTGPEFMLSVRQRNEKKKQEALDKAARAEDGERYTNEMMIRKEEEVLRLERNNTRRQTYQDAVLTWKKEADLAKEEKRRARWTKPKLGALEKGVTKPTRKAAATEILDEASMRLIDEESSDDDSDPDDEDELR